jgi:L-fuconolactonase
MRIDSHQHFWDLERFDYPWMPPDPTPLRRNFLPEHLHPILERNRFDGSIVVQATTNPAEAEWLLELAGTYTWIRGVVAWVDLTDPLVGRRLDALQRHPGFKGVRHPVQDEPDDRWLLRPEVISGLRELEQRGIPYDLLLRPQHLPVALELSDRVPNLSMVIDHIGKPLIAAQVFDGWAENMQRAAQVPRLYVKLSGMITEADWKGWTADHLRPYVQHIIRSFGPERCMFGSDWPVCLLAGMWKEVLAGFTQALGPAEMEIRNKLLGESAASFYKLHSRNPA